MYLLNILNDFYKSKLKDNKNKLERIGHLSDLSIEIKPDSEFVKGNIRKDVNINSLSKKNQSLIAYIHEEKVPEEMENNQNNEEILDEKHEEKHEEIFEKNNYLKKSNLKIDPISFYKIENETKNCNKRPYNEKNFGFNFFSYKKNNNSVSPVKTLEKEKNNKFNTNYSINPSDTSLMQKYTKTKLVLCCCCVISLREKVEPKYPEL